MAFTDLRVEINLIRNPKGSRKAYANLLIDNSIRVCGFAVVDGRNGLFVSPPQTKGKGKNEAGEQVDKWYDDVQWLGDREEGQRRTDEEDSTYKLILEEYTKLSSSQSKGAAANAQEHVSSQNVTGERPSATAAMSGEYTDW